MKIIAVDLDEVLTETTHALLKSKRNRINWKKITWDEVSSHDLWKNQKIKISKRKLVWILFWLLLGAGIWNKIDPVVGAKTKLKEFKKKWYKLYIVTARHFSLTFSTWIRIYKNYKSIFDGIKFANSFTKSRFSKKKSEICKKLWADIIIEDNLENAIECANEGIKVYLIDKPWNQAYDKKKHKWIIKVNSWSEIEI